jgi:hypothetical protein
VSRCEQADVFLCSIMCVPLCNLGMFTFHEYDVVKLIVLLICPVNCPL